MNVIERDDEEDGEYVEIPDDDAGGTVSATATADASAQADAGRRPVDAGADPDGEDDRTAVEDEDRREQLRAARRQERQQRKARQRAARTNADRTIEQLTSLVQQQGQQIAQLTQRMTGQDGHNVVQQMQAAKRAYELSTRQLADAIKAGKPELVAEALATRDGAADQYRRLGEVKERLDAAAKRHPPADKPVQQADPRAVSEFRDWKARNPWFDENLGDEDSRIAFAIDEGLEGDGYDMRTPEYWDELDARVRERLPHLFEKDKGGKDKGQNGNRRTPPVSGGSQSSGRARNGNGKGIFVSRERVEALKELGVWDDPAQRNRYIKAFQKYDRDHPNQQPAGRS